MIYNNGYPVNYGYAQPNQMQQNNNITWVQGEAGAKSYLVAPNTTMPLWDSENQIIYLKSADASGMPSIKILDYKIRDNETKNININDDIYVKKEELEDIKKQIVLITEQLKESGNNE